MDLNPEKVQPYGDTVGDGAVQLSFTLPLPQGSISRQAAKLLVLKMGFSEAEVVHDAEIGENFTFFVVYGKTHLSIDSTQLSSTEVKSNVFSREECSQKISEWFGRKIKIIGACIGEDAHTVGIDAIMNMKGYAGHYGLERFQMIESFNLGAQVTPETLISKAVEIDADAILVSQVVTQRDAHLLNLTKLVELVEAAGIRGKVVLISGGPRIDNALAVELGYDAGFGRGSFAEHVASFVIQEIRKRQVAK
jgi:beta-lysine 5,6-aminomutase beta subunit